MSWRFLTSFKINCHLFLFEVQSKILFYYFYTHKILLYFAATIPEEINRDCERCTSTETSNIRRILNYVKKHYPEFWDRVEPIYRNNQTVSNSYNTF